MTRGHFALAAMSAGTAACVLISGCLLPYVYPKLDFIPGCDPTSPKVTDIRAFRVDVTVNMHSVLEDREHTITEVMQRSDGSIPPQTQLSLERRTFILGAWEYFNLSRLHSTRVRLYSPGYRLIELPPWDSTEKIVWQPALDWRSQEQALLGLLAAPRLTPSPEPTGIQDLSLPTSNPSLQLETDRAWGRLLPLTPTTRQTKRVFDLAAAECERLAMCAPTPEDAAQVRKLAQKLIEREAEATKPKN